MNMGEGTCMKMLSFEAHISFFSRAKDLPPPKRGERERESAAQFYIQV